MNGTGEYNLQLNNFAVRTVNSGVKPLELRYFPVYDCYYGEVRAYRVFLDVNSVIAGSLDGFSITDSLTDDEVGLRYSLRALYKAASVERRVIDSGKKAAYSFIKVTDSLIYADDPYSLVKNALNAFGGCERLAFEFNASVMQAETNRLSEAFSSIRAANVKIAVNGYGGDVFPIEKLLSVCPDFVFTDEKLAEYSVNVEKSAAVAPVLNLVKSLGGNVIADGVRGDNELREFRARDSFGFIPAKNYKGNVAATANPLSADDILKAENDYD